MAAQENPPSEWGEEQNIAWSIDVPGAGWSAPIVSGDRVVLTTAVAEEGGGQSAKHRYEVHCYDLADGSPLWKRTVLETKPPIPTHRDNTFATETPVTDGERIYAYFGMTGLFCLDFEGEVLWKKDLGAFPMNNDWGAAASPVLHEGVLYLQLDNEQQSHLVALNAGDGSQKWRVERTDEITTWCTPIIWRNSQRTELVLGGRTVRSYEPESGKELWNMEIGGRSSASPAAVGDVLYVGSENRSRRGGTPGGLFAVKAGAKGTIDVTADSAKQQGLLWADLRGAIGMSSPLVVDGLVYIPERRGGLLRVHKAETGEVVFRERLPRGSSFWSSPWSSGGRVFCLDESGKTFVLGAGGEFQILGQNVLPGRFWSTPAISNDALLIRSADRLYCVRSQEKG